MQPKSPPADRNPRLARRQRLPEIMDQPDLAPELHHRALDGLRRINVVSRSAAILARPIEILANKLGRTSLSLCDVATGGADVPISLWQHLQRKGIELQVTAVDVSPIALEYAAQRAQAQGMELELKRVDVTQEPLPEAYDIVTSTLFLHHLDAPVAATVLKQMKQATEQLLLVSDLRRTTMGLAAAHLACRLFSRSHVVHVDGPRSVRGAFTTEEMRAVCNDADMKTATISHCWPFRMLVRWEREHA